MLSQVKITRSHQRTKEPPTGGNSHQGKHQGNVGNNPQHNTTVTTYKFYDVEQLYNVYKTGRSEDEIEYICIVGKDEDYSVRRDDEYVVYSPNIHESTTKEGVKVNISRS